MIGTLNYWTMPGINTKHRSLVISAIIGVVCRIYGGSEEDTLGKCRRRELSEARHMIAFLVRECSFRNVSYGSKIRKMRHSLADIGTIFNPMKDHATIVHSCRVVGDLLEHDKRFRERYNAALYHLSVMGITPIITQKQNMRFKFIDN